MDADGGHSNRISGEGSNGGEGHQGGRLVSAERRNIHLELALGSVAMVEARSDGGQGSGVRMARTDTERLLLLPVRVRLLKSLGSLNPSTAVYGSVFVYGGVGGRKE